MEVHFPLFLGKATYQRFPPMVSIIARLVRGKEPWDEQNNYDRFVQLVTKENYVCGARGADMHTPDLLTANLAQVLDTLYNNSQKGDTHE